MPKSIAEENLPVLLTFRRDRDFDALLFCGRTRYAPSQRMADAPEWSASVGGVGPPPRPAARWGGSNPPPHAKSGVRFVRFPAHRGRRGRPLFPPPAPRAELLGGFFFYSPAPPTRPHPRGKSRSTAV